MASSDKQLIRENDVKRGTSVRRCGTEYKSSTPFFSTESVID